MRTHPLSRRCIIFLKQDSAFSSDMNATDDIDIAILSVRLSISDTPELWLNVYRDGRNYFIAG